MISTERGSTPNPAAACRGADLELVQSATAKRMMRATLILATLYLAWLAMLGLHEIGHTLNAWLSGGVVEHVELPLLGFSRTSLAHNPHPLFVAWGGAAWGVALPLGLLGVARVAGHRAGSRARKGGSARGSTDRSDPARAPSADPPRANRAKKGIRGWYVVQFVAGFCLIANGAYLAGGSLDNVGDAGDLLRNGAARWQLTVYGAITIPAGLWLWNGLGRHFGLTRDDPCVDHAVTGGVVVVALTIAATFRMLGASSW